jgi:DNA modification methylase
VGAGVNRCFIGDCRETMRELIAQGVRVQTCVTSPPYWGLRDYGHAGQLGLESTPDEYVSRMVDVFRLVRDLLADDGTLWLNLGDSYSGSGKGGNPEAGKQATNKGSQSIGVLYGKTGETARQAAVTNVTRRLCAEQGFPAKQLIGIPWRVAFALQADGWYLRQDIIWHKPNPMPESVRDRCTKAHEYIFLLSKRERYYFDADAIAEPISGATLIRAKAANNSATRKDGGIADNQCGLTPEQQSKYYGGLSSESDRNKRSVWTVTTKPYAEAHFATFPPDLIEPCILAGSRPNDIVLDPFFGSGTTGEVAQRLGRQWIGCELNPQYEPLQRKRTAQQGLALA